MSPRNKPARVLHVIDSLHLGGAQEVVMNLATCGDQGAFVHEVATMHGHGVYWQRIAALGIKLHSLSPHKLVPWYVPSLAALLARGNFDILHCHLIASNIVAKPVGALCRVPVIINHDHTNDSYRARQRVRLALDSLSNRFATHIIAVSESCRQFLLTREGVPENKITLVQNAIDLGRYSPDCGARSDARRSLRLPAGARIVAGVGRLNPQKNFSLFVRIAAAVHRTISDAHFLLAGDGPEEELLRRQVEAAGLSSHFTFTGYVADTRQVYLAADVLLMPSLFEGLPMTLLEAMAMRLPVVASALDGIAEVITDGQDGFLVPDHSEVQFAERVTSLLEDAGLARTIGKSAAQTMAARFSVERMTSQVEAVYKKFLP